ncbi:hypothetical protein [Polluticaenibacter yanchengensis]|uniref:GLPGLI family protein n=1 Tax=Polluticaenibacter yanchengensis TaxID=3014562 RepID=A0ABT4UIM2_9BACT|nr:hypothetical protein [Chitinophagaceae bacterium LY-5]
MRILIAFIVSFFTILGISEVNANETPKYTIANIDHYSRNVDVENAIKYESVVERFTLVRKDHNIPNFDVVSDFEQSTNNEEVNAGKRLLNKFLLGPNYYLPNERISLHPLHAYNPTWNNISYKLAVPAFILHCIFLI